MHGSDVPNTRTARARCARRGCGRDRTASGSRSRGPSMMSTERTARTSSWSATAATGRLSASSTSIVDARGVGQQRAAPAARAERADRRQRQQRRVDRDDRALRREVVGGRAGGRRHQHAVGDQLGQPLLAVDQDAQPRRLVGLAEQRDLVDGVGLVLRCRAASRARISSGWISVVFGRGEPLAQAVLVEFVHQEADRAAVHAVDRLAGLHEAHAASAASGRRRRAPR